MKIEIKARTCFDNRIYYLPFDLQTALADPERVVTRDERRIEFLAHDKNAALNHRVLARIEGYDSVYTYYEDGRLMAHCDNKEDLFLLPKTRTLYLNIMTCSWTQTGYYSYLYKTAEEAELCGQHEKKVGMDYKLIAYPIEVPE